MRTLFYSGIAVLVLVVSSPAQRIWRVNCAGGPNVDYTDLPPAVAAASPGDTIWLYIDSQPCAPSYYYSGTMINKPLTIVGFNTFGVPGLSVPSRALVRGLIQVDSIPAGSRVVLSNVLLDAPLTLPPPPHGIEATDCAGSVLLEDVAYNGLGRDNARMRFDRCADVIIRGCHFRLSGEPVSFEDTSALISSTRIYWWGPSFYGGYTATRESLFLRRSDATLIGCVIDGGPYVQGMIPPQNGWARPGAVVESGTLTIGPATLLWGGQGTTGPVWSLFLPQPSQAQVFYDSRAFPLISQGPPPVTPAVVHATYQDFVVAGELYPVSVVGPPNGWAMLAVGSSTLQPVNLGFGLLAMDPLSVSVLGLKSLDSVGYNQWVQRCPAMVPVGHAFTFQAAVLDGNGVISLTVPSPFTVGWPHGVIP